MNFQIDMLFSIRIEIRSGDIYDFDWSMQAKNDF